MVILQQVEDYWPVTDYSYHSIGIIYYKLSWLKTVPTNQWTVNALTLCSYLLSS